MIEDELTAFCERHSVDRDEAARALGIIEGLIHRPPVGIDLPSDQAATVMEMAVILQRILDRQGQHLGFFAAAHRMVQCLRGNR